MWLEKLTLRNFRLFSWLELAADRGVVAIIGPNASGKSTILEAIFMAAGGRSARTHRDADLIKWGQRAATTDANFVMLSGRPISVTVHIALANGGVDKRMQMAGKPVRRTAELIQALPVVMFTPADLRLVQGEPKVRRHFLNLALARIGGAYLDDLERYGRALEQRNRLLHDGAPPKEIAPWTRRLVEAGARIAVARRSLVESLKPIAAEIHRRLSGMAESLEVEYTGDLAGAAREYTQAAEAFERLLAKREADERAQGRTLVGPHRDDLSLLLGQWPLRTYGSQGQQRTAALALKLAQASLMRQLTDEPPLLLLDDCLSELDATRAAAIMELAQDYEQIVVTSAGELPIALAESAQVIRLPEASLEMIADAE